MNNSSSWIVLTAITALVTLEIVALLSGINGAMFGVVIATIGGLAGYGVGRKIKRG